MRGLVLALLLFANSGLVPKVLDAINPQALQYFAAKRIPSLSHFRFLDSRQRDGLRCRDFDELLLAKAGIDRRYAKCCRKEVARSGEAKSVAIILGAFELNALDLVIRIKRAEENFHAHGTPSPGTALSRYLKIRHST